MPVLLGGKTPLTSWRRCAAPERCDRDDGPILTNFVREDRAAADRCGLCAELGHLRDRPRDAARRRRKGESAQQRNKRITEAVKAAGGGVILQPSLGEHGTVFVTGRDDGPASVPSVTLSAEHYNMIARHD